TCHRTEPPGHGRRGLGRAQGSQTENKPELGGQVGPLGAELAPAGRSCPLRGPQVGGPRKEGPGAQCHLFFPQSTPAHENNRDGRLVWTGTQEHLVSTGFNQVGLLVAELDIHTTRMREREVKLWDTRLFSGALTSLTLDTSPR
ncbi:CORO7, partial [Cervus elaphus hippelaphus]